MPEIYRHEFGSKRNGFGIFNQVEVDPESLITENALSFNLQSDRIFSNETGIWPSSSPRTLVAGDIVEIWGSSHRAGATFTSIFSGIVTLNQVGGSLNLTNPYMGFWFRHDSGSQANLLHSYVVENGGFEVVGLTFIPEEIYKVKFELQVDNKIKVYIDGGTHDNVLVKTSAATSYNTAIYPMVQFINSGNYGNYFTAHGIYIHNLGVNFDINPTRDLSQMSIAARSKGVMN